MLPVDDAVYTSSRINSPSGAMSEFEVKFIARAAIRLERGCLLGIEPRAVERAPPRWAGPHYAARALWAVGRNSTKRKVRALRATGFIRSGNMLSKTVSSTCRGVGTVELRLTA